MQIRNPKIEVEDIAEFAEIHAKRSVKVLQEFREFAVKGNVVDMAVGIIIGGAFGTIAKSLVDDIIMPPIGVLLNGVNFKELFIVIKQPTDPSKIIKTVEDAKAAGAVTVNYGNFLQNVLVFLIVAFATFLLVRSINRLRRQQQAESTSPTDQPCPYCSSTIPITARRCPHCTSMLDGTDAPAALPAT